MIYILSDSPGHRFSLMIFISPCTRVKPQMVLCLSRPPRCITVGRFSYQIFHACRNIPGLTGLRYCQNTVICSREPLSLHLYPVSSFYLPILNSAHRCASQAVQAPTAESESISVLLICCLTTPALQQYTTSPSRVQTLRHQQN